jgi:hypothetical protein
LAENTALKDHLAEAKSIFEDSLVAGMKQNEVYLKLKVVFFKSNAREQRLVNSWIIQAFGEKRNIKCKQCLLGKGDYVDCCTLPVMFGGACGNCKKIDQAAKCELYHDPKMTVDEQYAAMETTEKRNQATEDRATRAREREQARRQREERARRAQEEQDVINAQLGLN